MITQEYTLNLIPGGPKVTVHTSQYDKDSRDIIFSLFSGVEEFSIPSSASVTCEGTKKDKKGFSHSCTFTGNKVTVKPTDDMTAVAGDTLCEIVIEDKGQRLGSANFILKVEDGALGDGTDMSPSDVSQAYDILGKAAKAAADAQEMADHPNIPQNGTWWKWDKDSDRYVDTHQRAVLGIDKTYPSVPAMEADKGKQPENTVAIIQSNVEDESNAKLYIHNGSDWVYLADLSGFTGVGIEKIELTEGDHSPGTSDTYTITMDNGETSTFTVWNGATGPTGPAGGVDSVNGGTGDVVIGGRNFLSVNPSNWTSGNIDSKSPVGTPFEKTFIDATLKNIIRYYKLIAISGQFVVSVPKDYQVYFYVFDETGSYLGTFNPGVWLGSGVYVSTNHFLAVLLRRKDDSAILPTDISGLEIKIERGNVATDWTPAPEDKQDVPTVFAVTLPANAWANGSQTVKDARFVDGDNIEWDVDVNGACIQWDGITITEGQMTVKADIVPTGTVTFNIKRSEVRKDE